MSPSIDFADGGYSFIKGVFQYSAGVATMPGFRIERVRFSVPVPMVEGFERIKAIIESAGRPVSAFCACELRSPAPFSETGFRHFNEEYVGLLQRWGLITGGLNPVARTNVCPAFDPPAQPSVHAFSFTSKSEDATPSFVISGSGEAPEGKANYRDEIVARGNLTRDGLQQKSMWVLGEMERRMAVYGAAWRDVTAVQVYTVHDLYSSVIAELVRRGAPRNGVTWHSCRPPVVDLEYEMDCRAVQIDRIE
jgi:hypothetical protein